MNPDPRHVRAVSGALSEAERLWKGLPSHAPMRTHIDALQMILSRMLEDPPKPKVSAMPTTDGDIGPSDSPIDDELGDVLDEMGRPDALTLGQIRAVAKEGLGQWLMTQKVNVRRRLAGVGYERVTNQSDSKGGWSVEGRNTTVYARCELNMDERVAAAKALTAKGSKAHKVRGGTQKNSDASTGNRPGSFTFSESGFSPCDPGPTTPRPQGREQ